MEIMAAATGRRTPYEWWFDSRNTCCLACSPWLLSTLSDLNEKTQAMLRMLEEDADTFAQRAEMYYEKRPQLISLVEDFYRAQRSLLEQFDHLRHDVGTREFHISPLASSSKPRDDCFTKNPPKPLDECHELAYESEVDDFLPEVCYEDDDFGGKELKSDHEKLMAEIEKLNEESMVRDHQIMEKDKAIEEMQRKVLGIEREIEDMSGIMKRGEAERERMRMALEKVRAEKDEEKRETMELMDEIRRDETKKLAEELGVVSLKNEEQRELLEMKDEEKREVIRQLSLTIEMLKAENAVFKECLSSKRSLFNCFETSQSRVLLC